MRIIIADDAPNVCRALRLLLSQNEAWCVVGEVNHMEALCSALQESPVDMIVLDWRLPGLKGRFWQLRQLYPQVAMVALSGRPELGAEALAAGADGFVSKIEPPERLLTVISRIENERLAL